MARLCVGSTPVTGREELLMTESGEGVAGGSVIYMRGTDGSPAVRLGDQLTGQALSPDGKWIVAAPDVNPHLVLIPVKGRHSSSHRNRILEPRRVGAASRGQVVSGQPANLVSSGGKGPLGSHFRPGLNRGATPPGNPGGPERLCADTGWRFSIGVRFRLQGFPLPVKRRHAEASAIPHEAIQPA